MARVNGINLNSRETASGREKVKSKKPIKAEAKVAHSFLRMYLKVEVS